MMEPAIPTSVTPTTLFPYGYGRNLSSIVLSDLMHLFHINVTVQLNLPLKLLWNGPPLVATACAWVVTS